MSMTGFVTQTRYDRKIVTTYVNLPIPTRNMDWCAYYDGEEERGGYGYGATEKDAIDDLLERDDE